MDDRLKKQAEARAAFEHAIEADPKLLPAYVMLARLCIKTKDWEGAEKAAAALMKADPKHPYPEIYLHLAVARYGLKDLSGAEKRARSPAIRSTHQRPRAEYVLGRILEAKGDTTGAKEHMAKYLQLDPAPSDVDQVKQHIAGIGKSTAAAIDPELEPSAVCTNSGRRMPRNVGQFGPAVCPRVMLPKREIPAEEAGYHRRHFGCPHILPAQETVYRSGAAAARNIPLASTQPSPLWRSGTDEDRTRRAQSDQLVGVHRQVVRSERTGVFEEIAGHPVIFARAGDVLHELTEIAAVQLRAALAGGTDRSRWRSAGRRPWRQWLPCRSATWPSMPTRLASTDLSVSK